MREVVGVAVIEAGRVLAARRATPPELAGLWEFPGGKVEVGEQRESAAVREVAEELGCVVEIVGWLDGEVPITTGPSDGDLVLVVAVARLVADDPVPAEHDAVRWLASDELDEVRWVGADVPFLDPLRAALEPAASA